MRLDEFDIMKKPSTNGKVRNLGSSKIKNILNTIETQCSDYLQIVRAANRVLYRGLMSGNFSEIFYSSSRLRKPISRFSNEAQEICDFYLKTAGFKALRNNSIFCNSDTTEADTWGETYIIFPCNGFDYTWSQKYTRIPANSYTYPNRFDLEFLIKLPREKQLDISKIFVDNNQFTDSDLARNLKVGHDVWFTGNYFGINYEKYGNPDNGYNDDGVVLSEFLGFEV